MADRWHSVGLRRRVLAGLLLVSLSSLGVLAVGTVVPHFLALSGRHEEIDTGWLLAATGLALLVAVVSSVVVARRMVAPIQRIIDAVAAFGQGDHSSRLPDLGRPELAELVDSLNSAADEVARSELSRQRLTADIAHELRTPLTALQAGLEELRDGFVPAQPSTLDALHAQAVRLGRIVTDLAELSDAESDGLTLARIPVDLGTVVNTAVSEREHAMTGAGLVIRRALAPGVVVAGDADRLHQVVGNLLANCTAYCRSGDTVDVRVSTHLGRGVLEVADSGPGIDDTDRARAFDRRWRGEGSRATAGSGLGLPIVRALVLAHGGTVRLSAASPSGMVVRIELPLHEDTREGRPGVAPSGG